MGNTKSQKLKENYVKNKYKMLESRSDQLLGKYKVLRFSGFGNETYIQKILNPSEYDEYADINEFIKKLSNSSKHICEFHFVEYNTKNQELFDLIFEFGVFLNLPLKKEKYIWMLIDNVVEAMIFLEENMLHYPFLHKNYIIQRDTKEFKLINPYCFPDYLKEVLQIYMNPMNPVSNRKIYSQTQIRRNIKEFGVMIITIIKNLSIQKLLKEPNFWREAVKGMQNEISQELGSFIHFVLDGGVNAPVSFLTIKEELNKYRQHFEKSGLKLFKGFKTLTPRRSGEKSVPKKPVTSTSLNFTEEGNNDSQLQVHGRAYTEAFIDQSSTNKNNSGIKFKNNKVKNKIFDGEREKPNRNMLSVDKPKKKLVKEEPHSPLDEEKRDSGDLQTSGGLNSKRQSFNKNALFNLNEEQNHEFDFINNQPSPNKNITAYFQNKPDIRQSTLSDYYLDDLEEDGKGMIQDNLQPIEDNQDNTNNEDKEISVPQLKDESVEEEKEDPKEQKQQEQITNIDQESLKMEILNEKKEEEQKPTQQTHQNQQAQQLQQNQQTQQLQQNQQTQQTPYAPPQQVKPQPVTPQYTQPQQNYLPPQQPQKPQKSVRRVLIRWMRELGRFQKTLEYVDGTQEVVVMTEEEDRRYNPGAPKPNPVPQRQPQQQPQVAPYQPPPQVKQPMIAEYEKKSHMANYDYSNVNPFNQNISQMTTDNLVIFTLVKDNNEPPLLLFKTYRDKGSTVFSSVSTVVNSTSGVKPSNYHPIEDDPTVELRGLGRFGSEEDLDESKPTTLKSMNEVGGLNETGESMPTSFGGQKRLFINRKMI